MTVKPDSLYKSTVTVLISSDMCCGAVVGNKNVEQHAAWVHGCWLQLVTSRAFLTSDGDHGASHGAVAVFAGVPSPSNTVGKPNDSI
eukprot:5832701-Amphidinium_carterae.2